MKEIYEGNYYRIVSPGHVIYRIDFQGHIIFVVIQYKVNE